jgi:glucose/arabinose dehydrogenase
MIRGGNHQIRPKDSALKRTVVLLFLMLMSPTLRASLLPGFALEQVAKATGFVSSVAATSAGQLYYTTTSGGIYRIDGTESVLVAQVDTVAVSDSGLLGMALLSDTVAVVHYTKINPNRSWNNDILSDVVATVDLTNGTVSLFHEFILDVEAPASGGPAEHHGGNPVVGPDGSIYVGIGDYGAGLIAQLFEWNAGKIYRIFPNGDATVIARGFRNPFGMAFDGVSGKLITGDNGPAVDDEIDIVEQGGNYGWPFTSGNNPPIDGGVPPAYVFPEVVVPTGMVAPNGANAMLPHGILLTSFVGKALYYFPTISTHLSDPITIFANEAGALIDVAQDGHGEIYVTSAAAIFHVIVPRRGDCNGDGVVDGSDYAALMAEVSDGATHSVFEAKAGKMTGSWGCDVNGDGLINAADLGALSRILPARRHAARQ